MLQYMSLELFKPAREDADPVYVISDRLGLLARFLSPLLSFLPRGVALRCGLWIHLVCFPGRRTEGREWGLLRHCTQTLSMARS